jgi:hypothetical protein
MEARPLRIAFTKDGPWTSGENLQRILQLRAGPLTIYGKRKEMCDAYPFDIFTLANFVKLWKARDFAGAAWAFAPACLLLVARDDRVGEATDICALQHAFDFCFRLLRDWPQALSEDDKILEHGNKRCIDNHLPRTAFMSEHLKVMCDLCLALAFVL